MSPGAPDAPLPCLLCPLRNQRAPRRRARADVGRAGTGVSGVTRVAAAVARADRPGGRRAVDRPTSLVGPGANFGTFPPPSGNFLPQFAQRAPTTHPSDAPAT